MRKDEMSFAAPLSAGSGHEFKALAPYSAAAIDYDGCGICKHFAAGRIAPVSAAHVHRKRRDKSVDIFFGEFLF
jgi:hypothetical protein